MTTARRALITGITGQDGSYLAEWLLERDYEVWGMVRRTSTSSTCRIDHLLEGGRPLTLIAGDMADEASLRQVLEQSWPDEIYNLAAQSFVSASFQMPIFTGDVTGLGVMRLLESMRELGLSDARFYQASSSELFGNSSDRPQSEGTAFHPRNPYAVAKAYAFYAVQNFREAYGLHAVNGILFNHESPRRGKQFVTRKITSSVAEIVAGRLDVLRLGNLDALRDWGFAGDYVRAMWLMLQAEEPDDYVVATGLAHSVRQFCDRAFARAGLPLTWEGEGVEQRGVASDGRTLVAVDPAHFRPAEVDFLLGDAGKARRELGWAPEVSFAELVDMMVDADLQRAGAPNVAGQG